MSSDISVGENNLEPLVNTVIDEVNKALSQYGAPDGATGESENSDDATKGEQTALKSVHIKAKMSEMVDVHARLVILQKESETTNKKLDIITNKLSKLDAIESKLTQMDTSIKKLQERVTKSEKKNNEMEQSMTFLSEKYENVKSENVRIANLTKEIQENVGKHDSKISNINTQITDMSTAAAKTVNDVTSTKKELDRHAKMIEMIASGMDQLRRDKKETDERIVDLQYRSMKMNLIFENLEGENRNEDIYHKLRCFLANELDIHKEIQFGNIHRFGRFNRGRSRPVIARFLYQEDLDLVLERAPALRGSQFRIYRQYPVEMSDRRRDLKPIMDQFWRDGAHVKLVRDRLYVNGELYDPSDDQWSDPSDDIERMDFNQNSTGNYPENTNSG